MHPLDGRNIDEVVATMRDRIRSPDIHTLTRQSAATRADDDFVLGPTEVLKTGSIVSGNVPTGGSIGQVVAAPALLNIYNTVGNARSTIFAGAGSFAPKGFPVPTAQTYSFGPSEMHTGEFALSRPYLAPVAPLSTDFTANVPPATPAEAQLYARDPEELGRFADKLSYNTPRIRNQLRTILSEQPHFGLPEQNPPPTSGLTQAGAEQLARPITLPDSLSLLSPNAAPSTISGTALHLASVSEASVAPLLPTHFFGYDTPSFEGDESDGSGAPNGLSSVKAARMFWPGVCALELLYDAQTPNIGAPVLTSGFNSIFQSLDDSLFVALADLTNSLAPDAKVHLLDVTATALLRHAAGSPLDTRAQLLLNLTVRFDSSADNCLMYATALYDLTLDMRGALVLRPAKFDSDPFSNPYADDTFSGIELLPRRAFAWTENSGSVTSGEAALRLALGSGFTNEAYVLLGDMLLYDVPKRLNQRLFHIQMFPRAGDRNNLFPLFGDRNSMVALNANVWACNAQVASVVDPQQNLLGTRQSFRNDLSVAFQTDPGVGFFTAFNNPCGGAQVDFCTHLRIGFASMTGTTVNATGCAPRPQDDARLTSLLRAVFATDSSGNLLHWGCEGTQEGNGPCVADTFCPPLNTLTGVPSPGRCRDRTKGVTSNVSDVIAHSPPISHGCEPDITAGSCFFLPPASRIIPNPDGIILVYFDVVPDWHNAAFAERVAILGYNLTGGGNTRGVAIAGPIPLPFNVPNQPLTLCNYLALNHLQPPPVGRFLRGDNLAVFERTPYDGYGHPWAPNMFFRRFAVHEVDAPFLQRTGFLVDGTNFQNPILVPLPVAR